MPAFRYLCQRRVAGVGGKGVCSLREIAVHVPYDVCESFVAHCRFADEQVLGIPMDVLLDGDGTVGRLVCCAPGIVTDRVVNGVPYSLERIFALSVVGRLSHLVADEGGVVGKRDCLGEVLDGPTRANRHLVAFGCLHRKTCERVAFALRNGTLAISAERRVHVLRSGVDRRSVHLAFGIPVQSGNGITRTTDAVDLRACGALARGYRFAWRHLVRSVHVFNLICSMVEMRVHGLRALGPPRECVARLQRRAAVTVG